MKEGRILYCFRIVGMFLLLLPLFPFDCFEYLQIHKPSIQTARYLPPLVWLNNLVIILGVSYCSTLLLRNYNSKLKEVFLNFYKKYYRQAVVLLLLTIAILLIITGNFAFNFRPHIIDSISQLFQAKIFSNFKIITQHPQELSFFINQNFVYDAGHWSAQYPPGHSLLLAVGGLIGNFWISPFIMSFASAYMIYKATKLIYNSNIAIISLLLLTISSFFIVMGSSYMNHVSSLFCLSCFLYFFLLWEKGSATKYLYIASIFMGVAFLVRPYSAFLVGLACLAPTILKISKQKNIYVLFVSAFFFIMVASLLLAFNYLSTGDAFLTGYIKNWGEGHSLGFHQDPWGNDFALWQGILNQILNLVLLNSYLFESLIPGLLPIALFFIIAKKLDFKDLFLISGIFIYVLGHVFYWHTDFYLGPRFLYDSLIFLIPLTSRSINYLYSRIPKKVFLKQELKIFISHSLIVLALSSLFLGYGGIVKTYSKWLYSFKIDLNDMLSKDQRENSIVFVKVSWGNRMISKMRGIGLSSSLTEIAYQQIGACVLDSLIQKNKNNIHALENEIEELIKLGRPIEKQFFTKDGSLRLDVSQKLTPKCAQEIEYDRSAEFGIYAPHFLENDIEIDRDSKFIVAKDLRDQNIKLKKQFPNYNVFYLVYNKIYSEKDYFELIKNRK